MSAPDRPAASRLAEIEYARLADLLRNFPTHEQAEEWRAEMRRRDRETADARKRKFA